MHISDTVIHVSDSLNPRQRQDLEEDLRAVAGVIAPRFNPGKDHLLLVAYDPEKTSATALLGRVRERDCQASLVGL